MPAMPKPSHHEKSYWNLRRGDLPLASSIRVEPRLKDMEHNPVFRLLVWRDHLGKYGKESIRTLGMVLMFGYLPLSARFPGTQWPSLLHLAGIVLMIKPELLVGFRPKRHEKTSLLYIPDIFVDDLHMAAVGPGVFVDALWASNIRQRILLRTTSWLALLFLIALVYLLAAKPSGMFRFISFACIFLTGWHAVGVFRPTYIALQTRVGNLRQAKASAGKFHFSGPGCIIVLVFFGLFAFLGAGGFLDPLIRYFDSTDRSVTLLGISLVIGMGVLSGVLQTEYARRHAREYLRELEESVIFIVNRVASSSSEAPFAGSGEKKADDLN